MVNILRQKPVKWCSVNLSDVINRGKRFEASVFDIGAKQARQIIQIGKYPVTFIGGERGLTSSYTCARFKRIWLKNQITPYFSRRA